MKWEIWLHATALNYPECTQIIVVFTVPQEHIFIGVPGGLRQVILLPKPQPSTLLKPGVLQLKLVYASYMHCLQLTSLGLYFAIKSMTHLLLNLPHHFLSAHWVFWKHLTFFSIQIWH